MTAASAATAPEEVKRLGGHDIILVVCLFVTSLFSVFICFYVILIRSTCNCVWLSVEFILNDIASDPIRNGNQWLVFYLVRRSRSSSGHQKKGTGNLLCAWLVTSSVQSSHRSRLSHLVVGVSSLSFRTSSFSIFLWFLRQWNPLSYLVCSSRFLYRN